MLTPLAKQRLEARLAALEAERDKLRAPHKKNRDEAAIAAADRAIRRVRAELQAPVAEPTREPEAPTAEAEGEKEETEENPVATS